MTISLTPEDLQFLIDNKMALRFQHQEYAEKFNQEGCIEGDAYSLAVTERMGKPYSRNRCKI